MEGMPQVVNEAMDCGLPLIDTDGYPIPEVIEDEVTGFLALGTIWAPSWPSCGSLLTMKDATANKAGPRASARYLFSAKKG